MSPFERSFANRQEILATLAHLCAQRAMSALHPLLNGPPVHPEARVSWPGGSCAHHQAALLIPATRRRTALDASRVAGAVQKTFTKALITKVCTAMPEAWTRSLSPDLPCPADGSPAGIAHLSQDRVRIILTRQLEARPDPALNADRIRACLNVSRQLEVALTPHLKGLPGPARAAHRGEPVLVETHLGARPWDQVDHLGPVARHAIGLDWHNVIAATFAVVCSDYLLPQVGTRYPERGEAAALPDRSALPVPG